MDHQTTTKPPYPAMQKKRQHHEKEKLRQKGEEPSKSISPKEINEIQYGQIGQCVWIHHHTQRDAKSLELITPSRQRSKPRETANKDRDQRIQNTGATRRAFKAVEPNGPPKAEDLWGFHGDSMAMTKQFPLQSMIHLNELIVKQREKEKHELRSESTRKEECLRNIKNQIEQNESILNAKNNETQMEFKRMIRITKRLRKIRKESKLGIEA